MTDGTIQNLSVEVLGLIFEFLSPQQIVCARCVCQFWANAAENVIRARAIRGGPFIVLNDDEDVPVFCTLPLFQVKATDLCLSHPAVVAIDEYHSGWLLDRSVLAKIQSLSLQRMRDWPSEMFNNVLLPRVQELNACFSSTELLPASFKRVRSVEIERLLHPGEIESATPNCERIVLSCISDEVIAQKLHQWPCVVSLELQHCETQLHSLPLFRLRELIVKFCNAGVVSQVVHRGANYFSSVAPYRLNNNISYVDNTSDAERPRDVAAFPWYAVHDPHVEVLELPAIIFMPNLEKLEIIHTAKLAHLVTPDLRTLLLKESNLLVFNPSGLKKLEHLRLLNIDDKLDNLVFESSLLTLELDFVYVSNLNFLRNLPSLRELKITSVTTLECVLPCDCLPKLQRLHIDAGVSRNTPNITNLYDIGTLPSLETLDLCQVNVADLAWVGELQTLKTLRLTKLPDVTALSGVQQATSLQELYIDSLQSLRNVAGLKKATSLRRVDIHCVSLVTLDLSDTEVTRLDLKNMRCEMKPHLPAGLQHLKSRGCDIRGSLLNPCLMSLRYLLYHQAADNFAHSTCPLKNLIHPDRLKTLDVYGWCVNADMFAGLKLESLCVRTCYLASADDCWPACSVPAKSLVLTVVRGDVLHLSFVDPTMLTHFKLDMQTTKSAPSLAPLMRCTLLTRLSLTCNIGSLNDLAGHPSLEEINVRGRQSLDIAALFTCPRLKAANFDQCIVSREQSVALTQRLLGIVAV